MECWHKADDHFRLREQTFSTRTCNLGGAHSERFENRLENIKRTSNTTIPHYNPMSDPHLVNYRKTIMTSLPPGLRKKGNKKAIRSGSAAGPSSSSRRVNALRDKVKGERIDEDEGNYIVTPPLGTDHVLSLKRLFFQNSEEFTGICCRSEFCAVSSAGVEHERVRVINVRQCNLHELVCKGVSITNGFCSLHEHLPVPMPSMPLLFDWLVLLNSLETLDWPGFLLICTANLQADWSTVATIRNSYDCFVQQRPPLSETIFHELVAFLHYNHTTTCGGDPDRKIASFFQPGDFYRARHICNFAEAIFSLQPRQVQFYLYKANARGQRMAVNFCGHTSVTVNPIGLPPSEAVVVAKKRAASAHVRPPPTRGDPEICPRRQIILKQAQQLRYNRKVWT